MSWISVENSLPEAKGRYLVYLKAPDDPPVGSRYQEGVYIDEWVTVWEVVSQTESQRIMEPHQRWKSTRPTHWMEMLEAPQEV